MNTLTWFTIYEAMSEYETTHPDRAADLRAFIFNGLGGVK
jgi:hypothetical protein